MEAQAAVDQHPELFKDELGKLVGVSAKFYISADAQASLNVR